MRRLATPEDNKQIFGISHEKVVPFLTYDHMDFKEFKPIYQELMESGDFFVWEVAYRARALFGMRIKQSVKSGK